MQLIYQDIGGAEHRGQFYIWREVSLYDRRFFSKYRNDWEAIDFTSIDSYYWPTYEEAKQALGAWVDSHPDEWAEMVKEMLTC